MENQTTYYEQELLDTLDQDEDKIFLKNYLLTTNNKSGGVNDQITHLLLKKPYPTIQLLLLNIDCSKFHVRKNLMSALICLLEQQYIEEYSPSVLSFLSNIPDNLLETSDLHETLINVLLRKPFDEQLVLALSSRGSNKLYEDLLRCWKQQMPKDNFFFKEYVAYQMLICNKYFVTTYINAIVNVSTIVDPLLRNVVIILKLQSELLTKRKNVLKTCDNFQLLKEFDINESPASLRALHEKYYNRWYYFAELIKFCRNNTVCCDKIELENLIQSRSLIELIIKVGIDASFEDLEYILNAAYVDHQDKTDTTRLLEENMNLIIYYSSLCTTMDILCADHSQAKDEKSLLSSKLQTLVGILRRLNNTHLLSKILADIYKLLFLRWANLNREPVNKNKITSRFLSPIPQTSSSTGNIESDEIEKTLMKNGNICTENTKQGFVGHHISIYVLLVKMKNLAIKKIHSEDYKKSDNLSKNALQDVLNKYTETCWKYDMISKLNRRKESNCTPNKILLTDEEISPFIIAHEEMCNYESSDEEVFHGDSYYFNTYKKTLTISRSSTFCGKIMTMGTRVLTLNELRLGTEVLPSPEKSRFNENPYSSKGFISKIFISSESLAGLALSSKRNNETKVIIDHYSLENSMVDQLLNFENLQASVKAKLFNVYSNYRQLEYVRSETNQPLPTVEQIKTVAAKGFEVSKIISIISNFARSNQIEQSSEVKEVISRHITSRYPFLKQYQENNLNAILIADLIFDMPFNLEITSNIIMVIKRQQQINSDIAQSSRKSQNEHSEFVNLPSEMGVMTFLENLSECLRLIEQNQSHYSDLPISLSDLLSKNVFPLKPNKLFIQLQRNKTFETIFYKRDSEIGTLQDLRKHSNLLHTLPDTLNIYNKFLIYISNLRKLLQSRDPNLELHTTELLKQDPYKLLGELIFEYDMKPLELENIANALNVNLAHVIALNTFPDIVDHMGNNSLCDCTEEKINSTFKYVSKYSNLLLYLLKLSLNLANINSDTKMNGNQLKNYLEVSEVEKVSKLYNENILIAALQLDDITLQRFARLESNLDKLYILLDFIGNREIRYQRRELMDEILEDLIKEDSRNIVLSKYMFDIARRSELLIKYFGKITSAAVAVELIQSTLTHKKGILLISPAIYEELESLVPNIRVFDEVSRVMQLPSWQDAYNFGLKSPNKIFQFLLNNNRFKLCFEWSEAINLPQYFQKCGNYLLATLLPVLINLKDAENIMELDINLLNLLNSFPVNDLVNFFDENKEKFRSLALFDYVINYIERNKEVPEHFKNYKTSLRILKDLKMEERPVVWCLMKNPLLVIEELVMNAKFEVLGRVLKSVRSFLESENNKVCTFCTDKRGNVYDIHSKGGKERNRLFSAGKDKTHSAFILLNFNLYQQDHIITNECIDLLLRIYATKALEYNVSNVDTSSDQFSQISDMQSLDSLCGTFQMPRVVPCKEDWIRDEEASHCMSCRRTKFTMLMRRHHCRRCGRVVCFACSVHRTKIAELYAEVKVRVCNDCHQCLQVSREKDSSETDNPDVGGIEDNVNVRKLERRKDAFKWELSGNITHDKVVREEFSYDHAPSVALCLSILEYHLGHEKCVDLLMYHCRKLENLIVPNPEVDYELVAKMMNCLALAAKVRGAPPEVESICEHAEIIIAVVQNGCKSLIPPRPFDGSSLRKFADALVQAEHWKLALEVFLKWGFSTTGVMAAHGLACLPAGAYETAREKFSHCMTKLTTEDFNSKILKQIYCHSKIKIEHLEHCDIPVIKRPQKGPPLLKEILNLLASLPITKPQPETIHRASLLRSSNSSLVTLFSRRKEQYATPPHEAAINVLTRLANLKQITKGQYFETGIGHLAVGDAQENNKDKLRQNIIFEESFHYVLTYGSHVDVLTFLMNYNELAPALRYYLYQNLEPNYFIQSIYLVLLSSGQVPYLISKMIEINDERLSIWQTTLKQTCRYLETKKLLNSLYQLQVLLKDFIRASMSCVKFYASGWSTYKQLNDNAFLLDDAQKHLQTELEQSQWSILSGAFDLSFGSRKKSLTGFQSRRSSTTTIDGTNFIMQLDARSLNSHITTIINQLNVTKFLAKCENQNSSSGCLITKDILKQMRIDSDKRPLPTLFNGTQDKIQICILILYCGKNIEEGFGLAFRIIQDYKLSQMKVFTTTAKYLARNQRLADVEKLLDCISSNGGIRDRELDEITSVAINSAVQTHEPTVKLTLENLIKRIKDVEILISCHIFIGQLKSAYLLANKHERLGDIKKILRQAELRNQIHIKKLCEKKLNAHTQRKDPPK